MHKILPYSVSLLSIGAPAAAVAQPLIFTVDSQDSTQVTLDASALPALTQNTGTSGIVVLLCWTGNSSTAGTLDFLNPSVGGSYNLTLPEIQGTFAVSSMHGTLPTHADMGLVIGIKAGACAPPWLATSITPPVPMPTFSVQHFDNNGEGTSEPCDQTPLPASWDSNFGSQYLGAVSSLLNTLSTLTFTGTTQTLLSHVVAIADGAMLLNLTDEMGVYSTGCSTDGGTPYLGMTSYQAAETWASLPPPDNYTPAKAQAAYRTIFDGILDRVAAIGATKGKNVWGNYIAVTQTLDAGDASDWPLVDANGVPLPPQSPPVAAVPMFAPILELATNDALQCFSNGGTLTSGGGTLYGCGSITALGLGTAASMAIFGWPGLFNDSSSNAGTYLAMPFPGTAVQGVALIVNNGALYGGGVKWQFNNDNSGLGGSAYIDGNYFNGGIPPANGRQSATSCFGRLATGTGHTPPLADYSCFGSILTLANQSSGGTISTATTLSTTGTGINPSSPLGEHKPLLQWIEVKAVNGLPILNPSGGADVGPFYGCFHGSVNGTVGSGC